MAGSMTDYGENATLDHILGRSATDLSTGQNSTMFIVLNTSAYADTWTPLDLGECPGSTYARAAVANTSDNWTNSTAGSKQNKTVIEFTTAAGADWGTIKSVYIADTSSTTTGNAIWGADLAADQVISAGNTVTFAAGALIVTQS